MSNGEPKLNTNSYISLGLGMGLLTTLVAGFWTMAVWFGNKFDKMLEKSNELSNKQTEFNYKVNDLTKRIESMENRKLTDPWTGTDMFKWAARLQHDNTQVKVPEPTHDKGE